MTVPAWLLALALTSPAVAQDAAPVGGSSESDSCAAGSGLALAEEARAYIWDTEHRAALLEHHELRQFVQSLRDADAPGLLATMARDFDGRMPPKLNDVRAEVPYADVFRQEAAGRKRRRLTREAFVDWLLVQRQRFGPTPDANIKISSIHPLKRESTEGRWVGEVQLRLWGRSPADELLEVGLHLRLEFNAPGDGKQVPQGWLRRCEVLEIREARSPSHLLLDVTERTGIDQRSLHDNWAHGPDGTLGVTGGVYASDFNRDGQVDLLINDFTLPHGYSLYRGLGGGRFTDVTRQVGLPPGGPAMLIAFVDLDNDGWEDLILGPGLVFRNERGTRFVNVSARSNLRQLGELRETHSLTGIAPADFDRDGRIDLYLFRSTTKPREGSWINGRTEGDRGNQLLRNVGDWKFEDVTAASGTDGGKRSAFTSVWLDADNDDWPDLYVINEFGNGLLLRNNTDGTFDPQTIVDGPSDFGSMGLTVGDVDNDGRIDLYVASMYSKAGNRVIDNLPSDAHSPEVMAQLRRMVAGSQLYHGKGRTGFERVGPTWGVAAVGWAYGPSVVDLDNDGWLDLHVPTGFISRDRQEPDG